MNTEYDEFSRNNKIIKDQTRITVIICMAMVVSVLVYAAVAYFFTVVRKTAVVEMEPALLQEIFNILNIAAIIMVIIVLAVRKTIYYSSRTIRDDFSLTQILEKWRSIDIILAAVAESISVMGLVISLLGMPLGRTFHFFITSILVILIIMPINWKIRDKLRILNEQRDMNVVF